MCRTKENGGRRCPQHTDPVKHAAYNARRRELYAASKKADSSSALTSLFPEMGVPIQPLNENARLAFIADARKLTKALLPDFDENTWALTESVITSDHPKYANPASHESLRYYTDIGYTHLRANLEGRGYAAPETLEWEHRVIDSIDKAFEQASPPDEPRLLYRGMRIPREHEPDQFINENFPVGGVVSQKSYMSTSLLPSVSKSFGDGFGSSDEDRIARSVVFQIVSKQGIALGKGTSEMSDREKEILMPRNARFKVVSVDKGVDFSYTPFGYPAEKLKRTVIRLVDVSDEE